jgi:hypothetical protein
MIALVGVIGAGLFVGSGVVIRSAASAAVLSFALRPDCTGTGKDPRHGFLPRTAAVL